MTDKPTQLEWRKCCGHPSCKREYPTNFGTFAYGTGFEPEEKAVLETLWNTRSGDATELLREARKGFKMVHDALADPSRPRQTCGEIAAHWFQVFDAHLEGEA